MSRDTCGQNAWRQIGLLMALTAMSGCKREEKLVERIPPVQTFVLNENSEASFRRFPGEVAAADTSNLSFDVPGRLIEFPGSQEGLVVKRGICLDAWMRPISLREVDAARADFTNAQSELTRRRQLLNQRRNFAARV